jgi:AI-2 transport protein TqsA
MQVMKDNKIITVLLGVVVLFIIGLVLSLMKTVLLPFIIAIFLSFLFRPIVFFLKKRHVPMFVSLLLVLIVLSAVLFGLSLIVSASVTSFIQELPKYEAKLSDRITSLLRTADAIAASYGMKTSDARLSDALQLSSLTGIITSSLGTIVDVLSNIFLILLFLMFILAGSGEMIVKMGFAFSAARSDRISVMLATMDRKVRHYLVAKTFISLCTGGLAAIILAIAGVDFPLLWGVLMFLMNFIPNIGSLVATLFPVLLAFLQFDSITRPLIVLVLLVVEQNVIGNVIEPKVLSFRLNLSPLLILVSLIFWGWLWGPMGMILAIPLMSIIKIVAENVEPLKPVAVLMSRKAE